MKKKEANVAKAKKKKPAKKVKLPKVAKKKAASAKKKAAKPAKAAAKVAKKAPVKKTAKAAVKTGKKSAAKKNTKPVAKAATVKSTAASKIQWDQFLTPLDDRLIVEIASEERMTPGGLYIPDTVADTSGNFQGVVLVAGRGHLDAKGRVRPMDVKAGNKVLFSEYSGTKINLLGKDVLILRESEILGILD